MCDIHTPRLGSSLKHGRAHSEDHKRWTRRDFLYRMSAGGVAAGFMVGNTPFRAYARHPLFSSLQDLESDKILIILQLRGGNDGLNTIVPVTNDYYYQKRPRISISPQDVISLNTEFGLHPNLGELEAIWKNGDLGIIHGVGYEDTTLSHFRSTDIWATGSDPDEFLSTGWVGRAFDSSFPDYDVSPPDYPLAVQLGSSASAILQGSMGSMGMQIVSDKVFERLAQGSELYDEDDVPDSIYGQELAFARTIANDSYEYAGVIHEALSTGNNTVDYPTDDPVGERLAKIARMIKSGLPTHVYLASMIGFDTHSNQETRHGKLMEDLGTALGAFYNDLASSGDLDRVMLMTFSEFGRRVEENSSSGTDHGDAAPVFVMGAGVAGGFHGKEPDLGNVDGSGNMIFTSDFRSVYSTILEHWLGIDGGVVDNIFGNHFSTIPFVDGAPSDTVTSVDHEHSVRLSLSQNYPNPFSGQTRIDFELPASTQTNLSVYDATGKLIEVLLNDHLQAGRHSAKFTARHLASGIYICRLTTNFGTDTCRMTLVR